MNAPSQFSRNVKRILLNLLGALAVFSALKLPLSTALAQGTAYPLLTTFTNPTPAAYDNFGWSVDAVGTDRVLIGARNGDAGAVNAGTAYLFSTNGTLLTTFTNPTPAAQDYFGYSVAAVGTDRMLIGAFGDSTGAAFAGAAYLFSTNGTLLTTFTNLTPAAYDYFGWCVAAVGTSRVLIGAYQSNGGAVKAGAAYLFNTNGTLLTTFTNPTPAANDYFGVSVAAVGIDRVLIGAYFDDTGAVNAGVAYLFSTNATLLTTFTNPTPAVADCFGSSVTAVGTDRVLIGAYNDDLATNGAGAAYLFTTNAVLLTTFTNPTPAAGDGFGRSVVAVGTDRVLIGADGDDTGATNAGAAYLFSADGVLLATLTNSTPATEDHCGASVAAIGTNQVLIGAYGMDTGATDAGVASLFSLETLTPEDPSLTIALNPQPSTLTVSWPAPAEGWVLERTNALRSASAPWPQVPPPYQTNGGIISVTFSNTPATGCQFFRLHIP